MRKLTAALALVALIFSGTMAEARGGRTSVADCDAGSADPDCPDAPPSSARTPPPPASDSHSTQAPPHK